MPDIALEPGSGAERFVLHLQAHPGEYDRHAVAALLGVAPGAVDSALSAAVDQALVTIANNADLGCVWHAGPRMAGYKPALRDVQVPAAPHAPASTTRRGGKREVLTRLKLDALKVSADIPLPAPNISRRGESRHDRMLDTLTADGMSVTGIPVAYQAALAKAVQTYLEHRPELKAKSALYVRRMDDDDQHIGVWRVARQADAAQQKTGAKTLKRAA